MGLRNPQNAQLPVPKQGADVPQLVVPFSMHSCWPEFELAQSGMDPAVALVPQDPLQLLRLHDEAGHDSVAATWHPPSPRTNGTAQSETTAKMMILSFKRIAHALTFYGFDCFLLEKAINTPIIINPRPTTVSVFDMAEEPCAR